MSIKTIIYKLEAESIFNEAFRSSIDIFNGTVEHFVKKYYEAHEPKYTAIVCGLDTSVNDAKERYFNYIFKKECDRRTKKLKKKYCIIPKPVRILILINEVYNHGYTIEEL